MCFLEKALQVLLHETLEILIKSLYVLLTKSLRVEALCNKITSREAMPELSTCLLCDDCLTKQALPFFFFFLFMESIKSLKHW